MTYSPYEEIKKAKFLSSIITGITLLVFSSTAGYLLRKAHDSDEKYEKYSLFMDDMARKREQEKSEIKEALDDCNKTLPMTIDARCNNGRVEVKFAHPNGDNNGWIWLMRDRKCE